MTLWITRQAAKRTKHHVRFLHGGRRHHRLPERPRHRRGLYVRRSFLGISAQIFADGYDGLIYSTGFLVGWPIILFLLAERLRNLGRFTFADVASFRFAQPPVRLFAAFSTLAVVIFYLIAQMVGAGQLIKLLFGLPYELRGGHRRRADDLLCPVRRDDRDDLGADHQGRAAAGLRHLHGAGGAVAASAFRPKRCSPARWRSRPGSPRGRSWTPKRAAAKGLTIMAPGGFIKDPVSAISFGMALMFGTAGPAAYPDALLHRPRRQGGAQIGAVGDRWIGYFYLLTFIIGFGAITMVATDPAS